MNRRQQKAGRPALSLLIVAALAACTTIDQHKAAPADWPQLEVREHVVSTPEMIWRCYATLPLFMKLMGGVPIACAFVSESGCDIYVTGWTPQHVLEHEREHCAGRDHVGDSTLADWWAAYKAGRGK